MGRTTGPSSLPDGTRSAVRARTAPLTAQSTQPEGRWRPGYHGSADRKADRARSLGRVDHDPNRDREERSGPDVACRGGHHRADGRVARHVGRGPGVHDPVSYTHLTLPTIYSV